MDRESLEYSKKVFDEIETAVTQLDGHLVRLEPQQTGDIPTGLIGTFHSPDGHPWDIACNVIPTHANNLSTTFIQLYLQLCQPSAERGNELAELARRCNEGFMLGSLLVFADCLCMKYILALDPQEPLSIEHFQTTLVAFVRQAGAYAHLAEKVCSGMSAEQALAEQGQD